MKLTSSKIPAFNKIFDKFRKIPLVLGYNAFFVILFVIFCELIFGTFLFYQYVIFAKNKEPEMTSNIVKFDSQSYKKVINFWQEGGINLTATVTESITSPFEGK